MKPIQDIVRRLIELRRAGSSPITLLAVCPNSAAVAEAAVLAAQRARAPMLFAATLNQVDRDGGYTGWTPGHFAQAIRSFAQQLGWPGPLYPCLDHGGPWLKDRHRLQGMSYDQTVAELRLSFTACLEAGYQLLHIDPTVDRDLPPDQPLPVERVVQRSIELIGHAESERRRLALPPIAYEVGSEEVHGGLVDLDRFERFLVELRSAMQAAGLLEAWPCFVVAQVGTDLHTTAFDPEAARRLHSLVSPLGSLIKGHYTDDVENPRSYPETGMGGANVGPEFTAVEFDALEELESLERRQLAAGSGPSGMLRSIEQAVVESGRWQKWLLPEETGAAFADLTPPRRRWLLQTGARYIWTDSRVLRARQALYDNLRPAVGDPHGTVVERIAARIGKYLEAFGLVDSLEILGL